MAWAILSEGEDVGVGGNFTVFGTRAAGEEITVLFGNIILSGSFSHGGDTLILPGVAADYTVRLSGSQIVLQSSTISVTVPVGTAGMQVRFDNAELELIYTPAAGTVTLGDQTVTLTPQPLNLDAPASLETPSVTEAPGANESAATAQTIARELLKVAENSQLGDDSLPSATVEGSLSSATDVDYFRITLAAGELLVLDVDGTSLGLDTLIRVYDPSGVELTEADDAGLDAGSSPHPNAAGMTLDSFVSFRAPISGTYVFSIQSFDSSSAGSYELNISVGPEATPAQIVEEDIQALLSGRQWNDLDLTFGFPASADQYPPGSHGGEIDDNFEAFNPIQQLAVRNILQHVSQLTNLNFQQSGLSPGQADLRYAMSDDPDTAHAYYPGGSIGGSSWYNNSSGRYDNPLPGNYAWTTILHETGHALGLKHGHESPPVSLGRDSVEFTVMSYRSFVGAPATGTGAGYKNETWGFPQTLMMYDIAALQQMYGADFSYNAGDSIYRWNPTTGQMSINGAAQLAPGGNRVFMTVWDGGGVDTYDLSNYAGGVRIDLRPGEWTTTSVLQLANLGNGNFARGNVANSLLFDGDLRSLVENAIGGAGADQLTANQVANELTGGQGADSFIWRSALDSAPGAADTITDFQRAVDLIDLGAIDANQQAVGDQSFVFIGTGQFTDTPGELRYQQEGNLVRVQADLDGDGVANLEILLRNLSSLSASDFIT